MAARRADPRQLTPAQLDVAFAQLPDDWFWGGSVFRTVAVAVTGYQGHAHQIREKLLQAGRLEAVQERTRTWRYRKVKQEG